MVEEGGAVGGEGKEIGEVGRREFGGEGKACGGVEGSGVCDPSRSNSSRIRCREVAASASSSSAVSLPPFSGCSFNGPGALIFEVSFSALT